MILWFTDEMGSHDSIHFEAVEASGGELPDTRFGARGYGFRPQDLVTLPLWGSLYH